MQRIARKELARWIRSRYAGAMAAYKLVSRAGPEGEASQRLKVAEPTEPDPQQMACDHAWPACSRCQKSNRRCSYIISGHSVLPPKQASTPPSSSIPQTTAAQRIPEAGPQSSSIAGGGFVSRRPTTWAATGYLGYTSFSSVIGETLCILDGNADSSCPSASAGGGQATTGGQITVSRQVLQLGLAVLNHIPTPPPP